MSGVRDYIAVFQDRLRVVLDPGVLVLVHRYIYNPKVARTASFRIDTIVLSTTRTSLDSLHETLVRVWVISDCTTLYASLT